LETLIYITKAHLMFLILGAIYHFTLKNEKSFTFNRFYLLAIYGVSVTAPLLEFNFFKNITFIEPSLISSANSDAGLASFAKSAANNTFTLELIIPWVYGVLVSLSVFTFLIRFIKSYFDFKLIYRFASFDFKQKIYWVQDDIPPFTFLNKTLIPFKLQHDENKDVIIKHEEAHRKTLHFFDIFWVEILSSILVLNPLNRKIKKYVIENHEYLADDYACEENQRANYAKLLVQQTLNQSQLQFVSYFAKPTIINRLNMLKKNNKSKIKPFLAAFTFSLLTLIFSCDFNPDEEIILKDNNRSISEIETIKSNEVDETTIFSVVEKQAEPRNGIQPFYNAISEDLKEKYPEEAIRKGIQGMVYIQFVIEKDGSLSNIQAVKGIGGGCDEVAIEILKKYGDWKPGRQNGQRVRSTRVIPIRFVI